MTVGCSGITLCVVVKAFGLVDVLDGGNGLALGVDATTGRSDRMPAEVVGICEPLRTEHPFGREVPWPMASQPTA